MAVKIGQRYKSWNKYKTEYIILNIVDDADRRVMEMSMKEVPDRLERITSMTRSELKAKILDYKTNGIYIRPKNMDP